MAFSYNQPDELAIARFTNCCYKFMQDAKNHKSVVLEIPPETLLILQECLLYRLESVKSEPTTKANQLAKRFTRRCLEDVLKEVENKMIEVTPKFEEILR